MHDVLRVPARSQPHVNDFALKLANVNGTGSASANGLIMQAIFRMGIPVTGKNLFPSNIQGLPTWYEIRVNKDGYGSRALDYDLMVAMNSQTYARDVREVRSGGYLMYDSSWPLDRELLRDDITFLGVPLAQMCNEKFSEPRERILMKNIAYAGSFVRRAGHRHGSRGRAAGREIRAQTEAARVESRSVAARLRLRPAAFRLPAAVSSREDGLERRQDPDRRQYGHRARLPVRRRDGGRVVSDHAGDFGDGRLQDALRDSTAAIRIPARTITSSCKRKTSWPPSAWCWAPTGTARARSPPPPAPVSRS